MSNKVLAVPMQVQLHLIADEQGYRIAGTPPWVDEEKLKQWGDGVEGVLRKHEVAQGVHLAFVPNGEILAHYCGDTGVTADINTEVSQFADILVEALLADRETVERYERESIDVIVILAD